VFVNRSLNPLISLVVRKFNIMIQEEQEQEQDQNDQKKPIPKKQHQHHQHQTSDGPAIIFEADPKITDIFTCKDGDYFGLV
ncbi:MAG: hypothetical protein ACI90V_011584, partial [Bacillariaceae sp.]